MAGSKQFKEGKADLFEKLEQQREENWDVSFHEGDADEEVGDMMEEVNAAVAEL